MRSAPRWITRIEYDRCFRMSFVSICFRISPGYPIVDFMLIALADFLA